VVLKVDIENLEWRVFDDLEKTNTWRFVNELFVEVHYNEPDLAECCFWGTQYEHNRADAHELFRHLREDMQIYAHTWP